MDKVTRYRAVVGSTPHTVAHIKKSDGMWCQYEEALQAFEMREQEYEASFSKMNAEINALRSKVRMLEGV